MNILHESVYKFVFFPFQEIHALKKNKHTKPIEVIKSSSFRSKIISCCASSGGKLGGIFLELRDEKDVNKRKKKNETEAEFELHFLISTKSFTWAFLEEELKPPQ